MAHMKNNMTGSTVEVVVDNRLRIKRNSLADEEISNLETLFSHKNPMHFKLKKMGYKAWKEPAIIRSYVHDITDDGFEVMTFPRGGAGRLREVFGKSKRKILFRDGRTIGAKNFGSIPSHGVELWEHQEHIVDTIVERENCIVRSATGSGKTTAFLAAVSTLQLPTIIVVWESVLMQQWVDRVGSELGLYGSDVGIVGSGTYRLRPVTIAMQQSLNRMSDDRWREINATFGVVGCDELSRFASSTFQKTVDRFTARYRVGMSADEKRKDGKEFLIYDMFGDVAADVGASELVKAGIVHDVEIRVMPTDFRADWYVDQRRDDEQVPDFRRLLSEITEDDDRNKLVVSIVSRATGSDRNALVFSHRVAHCRALDSMFAGYGIRSGVVIGEDKTTSAETIEGLRSGTRQVGVGTYGKIGLGLDLPAVAAGVMATPCHNNRPLWRQIVGRICRTAAGKTDAVLWYLWDVNVYGTYPLYNLKRWNNRVIVWIDNSEWVDVDSYLETMKG